MLLNLCSYNKMFVCIENLSELLKIAYINLAFTYTVRACKRISGFQFVMVSDLASKHTFYVISLRV